jgi:hypothetical protein
MESTGTSTSNSTTKQMQTNTAEREFHFHSACCPGLVAYSSSAAPYPSHERHSRTVTMITRRFQRINDERQRNWNERQELERATGIGTNDRGIRTNEGELEGGSKQRQMLFGPQVCFSFIFLFYSRLTTFLFLPSAIVLIMTTNADTHYSITRLSLA